MSFCLITPRLNPAVDGVGDYCRQLMANLDKIQAASGGRQWQWIYLVQDGAEASRAVFPQIHIEDLQTNPSALLAQLENLQVETILLQYVGYGYANNGAPLALCESLRQWRKNNHKRRLIVMFHEVYSQGMPWQRVFWQVEKQKRAVSTLLDTASIVVTSMQANANSIRSIRADMPIKIIPIGANFLGQPLADKNWKQVLVFGKQPARLRALNVHKQLLEVLAKNNLLETVVLAGECADLAGNQAEQLFKSWNLPVNVISCYNFPADNIPDAVRTCGLSLMNTESSNLLKSGTFQLTAQLGEVAIARKGKGADPLFAANEQYLSYGINEETNLAKLLQDRMLLAKISQNLIKAASGYLSWEHIASAWSEILSLESQ